MKKLLIFTALLLPILAYGQTEMQIFNISNGTISTNSQFITMPEDLWETKRYSLGNPVSVTVGNQSYTIKTGRFSGWDTAPGDYDVIEISKNGTQLLLFKDGDGILKYNNSRFMPPEYSMANKFVSYADNDYFISVPLSSTSKALIFMGMTYSSSLPRLMIFVMTESDVKLVYCKIMDVHSMVKTPTSFSMTTQSNMTGFDDGIPVLHTIWLKKSGDFWFKNNY